MSNNKDRDDKMTFGGEVIESNKGVFKVLTEQGHMVNCKLNGRLKVNEIRVIVGDMVEIEVSPYCLEVGRISKRIRATVSI